MSRPSTDSSLQSGSLPSVRNSKSPATSQSSSTSKEEVQPLFTNPPERFLECPVCGLALRYPVKFPGCGHHCCTACLKELIRVEPRCPVDHSKFDASKVVFDGELNEKLNSCEVYCPNVEKTCSWIGRHGDTTTHLETCDFAEVSCPLGCNTRFERRFVPGHVSQDCTLRKIPCDHCEKSIRVDIMGIHVDVECPKVILNCDNKCGDQLPREKIASHLKKSCPLQWITCPFSVVGCTYEATRVEVTAHLKASAEAHMDKVISGLLDFQRAMKNQEISLKEHKTTMKNLEERIERTGACSSCQTVWKIDDFANKLEDAKAGNKKTWYSPPFSSSLHGYKMIASVCPNGQGKAQDTHMSVFVCIMKGEYDATLNWPFKGRVTFTLLDQSNSVAHRVPIKYSVKPNPVKENLPFLGRPILDRNPSFGAVRFVEQSVLELNIDKYVRDDVMFIKIELDGDEVLLV